MRNPFTAFRPGEASAWAGGRQASAPAADAGASALTAAGDASARAADGEAGARPTTGGAADAEAGARNAAGSRVGEPGSDELPGLLAPVWRSDWMRLRWVFMAAAAVFILSMGWSLIEARPKPLALILGLGEAAVFGELVVEGVLRFRRRLLPVDGPGAIALVAAMTVAATVIVVSEQGSLGLIPFFLAGMIAGRLRPDELAVRAIAAIAVASVLSELPYSHDLVGTLTNGLSVAVLSLTVFGIRVLQRTNRELLLAREELARSAVAEERLRISRDLHDVLGHDLSLIALKSELARRLLPDDPTRAAGEIADVERTARQALRAVRETVSGYRQPTLAAELAGAREALSAAGIGCSVEGDAGPLPPGVEAILAWTVREGTTNVIRHSGARHCRVRVDCDHDGAWVELADDGGLGPAGGTGVVRAGVARGAGSGLPGLAERVAASGGRMEAGPQAAGGFRLKVSVPIEGGMDG